jgi:amino-acid N-acetyltransferase
MSLQIRPARTQDVLTIRGLIDTYSPERRLLSKHTVTIYEDVQEFVVADLDGEVVGCGALHVMWEDLGEVRTLAVAPEQKGKGIGTEILRALLAHAQSLGLRRLFCLTFETDFFGKAGFVAIEDAPVDASVYAELLMSGDEGVAEFLDLERVKPNTLGNTRMLLDL